jgi:hypothetical protein
MPYYAISWTLAVDTDTVKRHIAAIPAPMQVHPDCLRPSGEALTPDQECAVIAFYCQSSPPPGIKRWTLRTAAKHLNEDLTILGRTIHHSTIGRTLKRHHMRPHKSSYFLHIRDPLFIEKMHHILGVYARCSDYTFCFDECPNIQALSRSGPDVHDASGGKHEFVYQRNGTTDLFGFLRVSEGTVDAYCRPTHETETLIEVFIAHVEKQPSDEKLDYICDNLSPHFNIKFCRVVADLCGVSCPPDKELKTGEQRRQWLQEDGKRINVHFLPFHGSWLNQVEVWFGLLRRYTLVGSWFSSVDALVSDIEAFAGTWNTQLAHPFNFRYTGEGLENRILSRFDRILSQAGTLEQLDSKFIADMSFLSIRLITHHKQAIDEKHLMTLLDSVALRKKEILEIIRAEPGPKRRPRAHKAFQALCEYLPAS